MYYSCFALTLQWCLGEVLSCCGGELQENCSLDSEKEDVTQICLLARYSRLCSSSNWARAAALHCSDSKSGRSQFDLELFMYCTKQPRLI